MRVCSEPGCPELYPKGEGRWCREHRAKHEQARGSRAQRGYDAEHIALRKQWAPRVATGTIPCWRCKKLINRGQPWHLGHDDTDRTKHRGPEHMHCNLSAAGKASHGAS